MTSTPEWAGVPADQELGLLISSVGDDPKLRAAIANAHAMLGTARREYQAEQLEKAETHFLEALKIADYVMETLLDQNIGTWNGFFLQFAAVIRFELSIVLLSNHPDSYQGAVDLLQDARELYEMTEDRESIAETWNALADIYAAVGDTNAAKAARNEAIRAVG